MVPHPRKRESSQNTSDYSGFGVIILSADSEGVARQLTLDDSAIQNRVMRAELNPFRVALVGVIRASGRPEGGADRLAIRQSGRSLSAVIQ